MSAGRRVLGWYWMLGSVEMSFDRWVMKVSAFRQGAGSRNSRVVEAPVWLADECAEYQISSAGRDSLSLGIQQTFFVAALEEKILVLL